MHSPTPIFDVVVVGAGPAGLAAGFEAKRRGLRCVVLEKGRIASTVSVYPLGKPIYSDASDIELEPNTFGSSQSPTRENILNYYQKFSERVLSAELHEQTPVLRIDKRGDVFIVLTPKGTFAASHVIVAVGGMGITNLVDAPGEDEAELSYHCQEIRLHRGERVLVLGGGNSAAEAVCDLQQEGAHVTWIVRRPSLDLTVDSRATPIHPSARNPVEALHFRKQITILFGARVLSFSGKCAVVAVNDMKQEVAYDAGFALLGHRPDQSLVRDAGVVFDADGVPAYDMTSGETSVPGLFVVGHCTREINLKNAITRPRLTVAEIAKRLARQSTVNSEAHRVDLDASRKQEEPFVVVPTSERGDEAPRAQALATPPSPSSSTAPSDMGWVLTDPGAIAVGLTDYQAERSLAYASNDGGNFYERLMVLNSAVIRAKLAAMAKLRLPDSIEDILITTGKQLHVFRVLSPTSHQFLAMILDRRHANLALARYRLRQLEEQLAR